MKGISKYQMCYKNIHLAVYSFNFNKYYITLVIAFAEAVVAEALDKYDI